MVPIGYSRKNPIAQKLCGSNSILSIFVIKTCVYKNEATYSKDCRGYIERYRRTLFSLYLTSGSNKLECCITQGWKG